MNLREWLSEWIQTAGQFKVETVRSNAPELISGVHLLYLIHRFERKGILKQTKVDDDKLYEWTGKYPPNKIVIGAYKYNGSLFMVKRDLVHGRILVGYPMLKRGTIAFESEFVPEPENIEPKATEDLKRIAKMLNCKLY